MSAAFSLLLFALKGTGLRFGPMRLTVYGICAAAGLLLAMMLSGRTGRRTGLRPEAAADAGLFAVVCCFVASRLLLILSDPRAFLHFPLLILGLPSLTFGGMLLAGAMVWLYLRRKRLRLLQVLDAFAAPAALLATFLELGHLLDGSEVGMPLRLNWTAPDAWNRGVLLHPVALYGVVLAAGLAALLSWQVGRRRPQGRVAAAALVLGGFAAFGLHLLSVPEDLFTALVLEPGQLVALGAVLAGSCLWLFAPGGSASAGVAQGTRQTAPPATLGETETR